MQKGLKNNVGAIESPGQRQLMFNTTVFLKDSVCSSMISSGKEFQSLNVLAKFLW